MEFLKILTVVFIATINHNSMAQEKSLPSVFSKSYSLETNYQYAEAIKIMKEVYSESSYTINMRLGWLYYLSQNYTTSISYYQKAVKLMPAATEPLWALSYPQIAAEKWADVDKTYAAIIKLDPKNSTAHYKLGLNYYYRKNYSVAKQHFDIALNLYPSDYNILLYSAWTNYFLGKTSDAKVLFNKVLLLDQNDVSALEGLGLIK
jgi:tetratricopeptide (TPR) repeat protein